jgi:hypothetical protein
MRFRSIERLAYWQGQELRSGDFRDQTGSLEQLRWWHDRAAHQVFGVSQGLAVTVKSDAPGTAHVGWGLAYDCFGRELILASDQTVPIPSANGPRDTPRYLVAVYVRGIVALQFFPLVQAPASRGVPIALFQPGSPYTKDGSFRAPAARALSRPRLGAGSTVPGNTSWQKLPDGSGLQVRIDTSGAGFTRTPFYLTSLIWEKENVKFSTPVTDITDSSDSEFTLALLLKDIGRESFSVVLGAGLVSTIDTPNRKVAFRQKVQFGQGQDFQQNDVLARLAPAADVARAITDKAIGTLGLGPAPAGWVAHQGDTVVLGSLPAMATVQEALMAVITDNPGAFQPGSNVFRMAGTAAGAASTIQAKTSDGTLVLATPLAGFTGSEKLGTISPAGKVTVKTPTQIALDQPTDGLKNAIVIRISSQMNKEVPTTVTGVNADKTINLASAIGLNDGDQLGVVAAAATGSPGTALTVDTTSSFRGGDLVGVGLAPQSNNALLKSVENLRLVLASPVNAAFGETVVNADLTTRASVAGVFTPAAFFIPNILPLQLGQTVAHVQGAQIVEAQRVTTVFAPFNLLAVANPMPAVTSGEVIAVARFNRSGKVKNPGTGAGSVSVQMQSAADAAVFQAGDTVARAGATGPYTLAVVNQVSGDTLTLRTAIPELVAGDTLAVATLNAASIITDPPDATHIVVDLADYARAGGIVGRFTGWTDASAPVTLATSGVAPVLSAIPDGLMTGDAIGFAGLSPSQNRIRFDASARVGSQPLTIQGPDEHDGSTVTLDALVTAVDNQLASLQFIGNPSFLLRPESIQVTGGSQIDDFLVYAQQQGLSVSWLGCQMPAVLAPTCPGVIAAPCKCQ